MENSYLQRRIAQLSVSAAAAAVLAAGSSSLAASEVRLNASHQWPGGQGDFRDEMVQILADRAAESDTGLEIRVYPDSSLYGAREQWPAIARGRLDITALPLAYAGGRHPEFNLTLMPGLVKNHDHAQRLNESAFMDEIVEVMEDNGVKVLAHTWLAGGFGSNEQCITAPEDVDGAQIRGAGQSFETMLSAAGASINSMPSSEIYTALQTGVLDSALTSSASWVSYRLYEQTECVTPPGDYALWFMYEPILISKASFNDLTEAQQQVLLEAGEEAEAFAYEAAQESDQEMIELFREQGVEVAFMDDSDFEAWRSVAEESAFPQFVESTPRGQELLDKALSVD
ncbi:MAG: TRAP transporter substrate-binding protein DctP [Halorhodospira halophila]|uniref:TRAP transporter substrate-binding protein DctP n=1 Tax=Halorhodospira halophila TaxID=1053 RepID=UPI0026EDF158|nr:TRAP transporter substrate-binding protein DctP [Halorhodospira halophila]MCC3751459.1 TRAP transporter substrate-binding protein DctP [Halorhodospira halophila]